MKICLLLLFTLFLGGNSCAADLLVGQAMPEVQAKLLDSPDTFRISQQRGKVLIVNFWATWCAPCKAEMPTLQAYFEAHKTEGLEILAISMDETRDLPAVRQWAQQFSFLVALKADADYKALGRIWRMPTTFVIDRDGILRKNGHVGDAEISMSELEALVTPLLKKR